MNFLNDVINQAIEFNLYNLHTATPARFESYDPSKKSATVQPVLKRKMVDGTFQALPQIENVPVIFPFGGGNGFSLPINVGDYCLLIFTERSLDQFLADGGLVDNIDTRIFDITDAIAIPGLSSFADTIGIPNNNDIILKYNNSLITIQQNGDIILNANGTIVKLTASGTVAIGNSPVELLDQITQLLTSLIINLATGPGPYPDLVADATTIRAALTSIKGTL